jgi:hypothetical protein
MSSKVQVVGLHQLIELLHELASKCIENLILLFLPCCPKTLDTLPSDRLFPVSTVVVSTAEKISSIFHHQNINAKYSKQDTNST